MILVHTHIHADVIISLYILFADHLAPLYNIYVYIYIMPRIIYMYTLEEIILCVVFIGCVDLYITFLLIVFFKKRVVTLWKSTD